MPDWIGGDGWSTAETYRRMADDQLAGVSPSYERVCRALADDADALSLIDRLPPPKRQPNLLLGAVRFLDGPVDDPDSFIAFMRKNWVDVEPCMRAHATQTNEPNRCAALLPTLAALPQPLALLEVGASAGLCLYPDRYRYDYDGHVLGDGPTELRCTLVETEAPARRPEVVWRAGLDVNPLDVTSDDDIRWLEALIWPEQIHRFETLRTAAAQAAADPPRIVRGDLTCDLVALAAQAPPDATLVIFHSAVLAYLPGDAREAFYGCVRDIAAQRPTAWVSNEGVGVVDGTGDVELHADERFVVALDGVPVGACAPHGGRYRALP